MSSHPASPNIKLILASASPRRRQLLTELGLVFEVDPADIDETTREGELPSAYVLRVAREKARVVALKRTGALSLAADTSVIVDQRILGKPRDATEAAQMLELLSGRTHQVITAVAVAGPCEEALAVTTQVTFRALERSEIDWYVSTGEGCDKAGGYAVQGLAGAFVRSIEGSHSNVIGLPLCETLEILSRCRVKLPWSAP